MINKYTLYAIILLVFYAPLAYSMKRVPAVRDSIAKMAKECIRKEKERIAIEKIIKEIKKNKEK